MDHCGTFEIDQWVRIKQPHGLAPMLCQIVETGFGPGNYFVRRWESGQQFHINERYLKSATAPTEEMIRGCIVRKLSQ